MALKKLIKRFNIIQGALRRNESMKIEKTKIICTIGPATSTEEKITELIKAGMDVARLNFSHGTHEDHHKYFDNVRNASKKLNHPVAILQDLQGIKIRINQVEGDGIILSKGDEVILKPNDLNEQHNSTKETLYISYDSLINDLKIGDRIMMDDGLLEFTIISKTKDALVSKVKEGGILTSRKGVNLPDTKITLSPFTDKDRSDLIFGAELGVDYIALSFVMGPEDITKVKLWMEFNNIKIPIIAKIEKPEAVKSIKQILDVSDGIMVARGDLGVEMSPEQVPFIQKELIYIANQYAKPVITATQMLESMRNHQRPTRAEAADVANAILDGTDAVMLSAETSSGDYPIESVQVIRKIIEAADKIEKTHKISIKFPFIQAIKETPSFSIAAGAVRASDNINAKCIVVFSKLGVSAMLVSKCRPQVPIIVFTPDEQAIRRMAFYWGVRPLYMKELKDTEELVSEVDKILLREKLVKKGDSIIIVASHPLNLLIKTNYLKVHQIGEQ